MNKGKSFPKISKLTERDDAYHFQFDFPQLLSADETANWRDYWRDYKSLGNGKEISAVPFRTEKEIYL